MTKKKEFDYTNLIILAVFFFCVIKANECSRHEMANDIMRDNQFRKENNIKTRGQAEEAAEHIMDSEVDN